MPLVAGKVWTAKRRMMGNLVPAVIALPFGVAGVALYRSEAPFWGPSLWFLLAFVVVGWLSVNAFGFYQNQAMRSELGRKLDRTHGGKKEERYFVGCARPSYRSVIDSHEDVGFLIFHPDHLEFFGDSLQLRLDRRDVDRIRFRPNPHTFVGLGRWISLEGQIEGKPVRLSIEPREKGTLLANRAFSKALKSRIEDWKMDREPQASA